VSQDLSYFHFLSKREIVKSTYSGVANSKDGQKIYLPDIDSTPGNGMDNGEDDESMVSFNMLYTCNTDPCIGDVEVVDPDDACSCIVSEPKISGCMDASACNFNANANCDDDSCQPVPLCNTDACEGDLEIIDPNNPCSCKIVEPQVSGCMNPSACNYNANANCDDDNCQPVPVCNVDPCEGDVEIIDPNNPCSCKVVEPQVSGCMNPSACNFKANANCDDGSCKPVPICNVDPCEGDVEIIDSNNACRCKVIEPQVSGCMDASACNFNANANCDDGSCQPVPLCNVDPCEGDLEIVNPNNPCSCKVVESQVFGCTDNTALNYTPTANCDDNSCYDADSYTAVWPGDADANGIVNNTDVLYIGLAEGKSGLNRENATSNWTQQMAIDWEGSVLDINNKHQDSNGDGTIDYKDLQAVEFNYGKSNVNENINNSGKKIGTFKLYQVSLPGELPIIYDLVLDTDNEVLVHGIKGSIDLSKYFSNNEDAVMIKTETSVLEPELVFTNYNSNTKILEYALSRTDGNPKALKKGDVLFRALGIVVDILEGGDQAKLTLLEGGIIDATGKLHRIGNSSLQSKISKTPEASPTLNFNIITTPSTCSTLGTAEIDMFKNYEHDFIYLWSNGANTFKVDNLVHGTYNVDIANTFRTLVSSAEIIIEVIPETEAEILLNKEQSISKKFTSHQKIKLGSGFKVLKDTTVELAIDNCFE